MFELRAANETFAQIQLQNNPQKVQESLTEQERGVTTLISFR